MSFTSPLDTPWLLLSATLPGRSGTPRVRLWRGVRDLGAVALRDGVYLLPDNAAARTGFARLAAEVAESGGEALVLDLAAQPTTAVQDALVRRFDRMPEFATIVAAARDLHERLDLASESEVRRVLRGLQRDLAAMEGIDFFPGDAREQARVAVSALATAINRRFSPAEPSAGGGAVRSLAKGDFQGRRWATRKHLWVDRVASAWLIRRFIDPTARFLWLDSPADCPADVLGFDYDGAAFSHVGEKVTFEVLLASFGLDADPGLTRLGQLVHYLDAGGLPVAEAAGFEAMLAGLRAAAPDDDALLAAATPLLDALYRSYASARS